MINTKMFYKYLYILLIICVEIFSSPIPAPHKMKYDQSQHGELNVRADLDNILVLFIPSGGLRLLDEQQIGSIISILSNSRRNELNTSPPVTLLSGTKESPYKVDVDQAAIDKLHSDIDSLNTIIPAVKNYNNNNNQEKKEIDDKISDVMKPKNAEESIKTLQKNNEDNNKEEQTSITTDSSLKIEQTSIPLEVSTLSSQLSSEKPQKSTTEQQKIISTSAPITSADITTSESIVTSTQLKTTSNAEREKVKPTGTLTILQSKPTSVPTVDDIFAKLKQRIIEPTHSKSSTYLQPQVKSSASSTSSTVSSTSPKTPKYLNDNDEAKERQIKALQAGLVHCLPGQKFNESGDCIDIQPTTER